MMHTSWNVPIGETTPTMTLGMLEVFGACTPAFLRLALCEREKLNYLLLRKV